MDKAFVKHQGKLLKATVKNIGHLWVASTSLDGKFLISGMGRGKDMAVTALQNKLNAMAELGITQLPGIGPMPYRKDPDPFLDELDALQLQKDFGR